MRRAWRVAVREYMENAKTKGFWVGIILFPVMVVVFSHVPQFLEERAVPTRHYVVVDRSGEFGEVVSRAMESTNRRRVLEVLIQFAQEHAQKGARGGDPAENALPATVDGIEIPRIDREEAARQLGIDPEDLALEPGETFSALTISKIVEALPDELFAEEERFAALQRMTLSLLPPGTPEFEPPRARFLEVPLPAGIAADLPAAEIEDALKPYLSGDRLLDLEGNPELFALLIIPEDVEEERGGLRYWSKNRADVDVLQAAERSIASEIRQREFEKRGVSPAVVKEVQAIQVHSESFDPKKAVGEEKVNIADKFRQWAPVGFVYLLWIAIFSTAQMLLNNMIEEKSNKIVEVLLSSVTPNELMGGKLLGIALVGLTMLAAWLASLYGVLEWKASPEAKWALALLEVVATWEFLIPFAAYFVLGYLLYAGLFASIGSICNTLKEAQNFMGPVMMVMMVPLITMFFIPRDPNGTLATVLSWIPFYTPFVMMNRAAADPPVLDLVGTLLLLLASTVLAIWASGRIFRVGMLRTGQPPRIIELWRWIRQPS